MPLRIVRAFHHAVDRSLTLKITAASGVMVLALSGIFWYRSIRSERQHLFADTVDYAASLSDLVRKTLRDGMLHNDREHIRNIVASIAGSENLRALRVYDRRGRVVYSSVPGEVGSVAGPGAPACRGCHTDPQRPRETLFGSERYVVQTGPEGEQVLRFAEPLLSEPGCVAEGCHGPGTRVLGILLAEFPLTRHEARLEQQLGTYSSYTAIYVLGLAVVGSLILWQLVLRPVRALADGMERVAGGDLSQPVPVVSEDDIGRLAESFNGMVAELAAARARVERWTQSLEEEVARKTDAMRRSEARLAESERLAALGRLTAEIAHEIRNPLTALGGYGRRLQLSVSSPRDREYARIVVDEAARLENLLRDLLDYSRPARLELRDEALAAVAGHGLDALGVRCAERGVVVTTDLDDPAVVPLDAGRVRRAVDNLLSNAIDAMPKGGTLGVATRIEAEGGRRWGVLEVSDTGPGIPPGEIGRIFEPYWTTKRLGRGTGLGLPITRTIVEAHGGYVRLENRPQGGVRAQLRFPADPQPAA